ncbi:MAG: ArsR/SmtB family transcription factor [bacterium]
MVKYYTGTLDLTFMALADPTRRAILMRLTEGECTVSELAQPFDMSLPAVSKHLKILENAGLLSRRKEGRIYRCRLKAVPLKEAAEWISRYREFWQKQFDALDRFLNQSAKEEKK